MPRSHIYLATLLAAGLLLTACGGPTQHRARAVAPLGPSKFEREYFADFHTTSQRATPARDSAAAQLAQRLRHLAAAQGAQVVSLRVYRLAREASHVPVLTIAVARPAPFLRDSLTDLVRALNPGPYYLRVVDPDARRVLELWTPRRGRGGYSVEPRYAGCNLITESGLGGRPPCPRG